jgi:hypothetical protein
MHLEKLWVTITVFGKTVGYYNVIWKNYGLVELHLEKLWVTIVTTFGKTVGYYCNGIWKNCGFL